MIKILGDSFCDIITSNLSAFPRVGGDALAAIRLTAGGSALNTALHGAHFALTILDGNVAFEALTAVGNDYQGSICSEAMNHPLLKQSVCKDHGYSTGTCIVLSHGGDRSFITDRGCVDRMSLQWFGGIDAVLQNCAAIHIAGYYNLGLLRQELIELCRQAKNRNIPTALNPQYDASELWDGIQELSPYLSILIVNELELKLCATTVDERASPDTISEDDAVCRILSWGCGMVVVTRDVRGSSAYRYKEKGTTGAVERYNVESVALKEFDLEVVDATGAGDAFCGAFLATHSASGGDVMASLIAGNAAGAASVTVHSGSALSDARILSQFHESLLKRD